MPNFTVAAADPEAVDRVKRGQVQAGGRDLVDEGLPHGHRVPLQRGGLESSQACARAG